MRSAADERWSLTLRSTANLIGFALFPVGWTWDEYAPPMYGEPMPYEESAVATGHLGIEINSQQSEAGNRAVQNGIASRKAVVENHLTRMIKRKEIPVTVIDHRMEGHPLGDRMRLDVALRFDIDSNTIGLFDLKNGYGFDFQTDNLAVMDALNDRCAWHRNKSVNNWFYVERYLRILYETYGRPETRDEYAKRAAIWYAALDEHKREPAKTELRQLSSRLYDEYADPDSEI